MADDPWADVKIPPPLTGTAKTGADPGTTGAGAADPTPAPDTDPWADVKIPPPITPKKIELAGGGKFPGVNPGVKHQTPTLPGWLSIPAMQQTQKFLGSDLWQKLPGFQPAAAGTFDSPQRQEARNQWAKFLETPSVEGALKPLAATPRNIVPDLQQQLGGIATVTSMAGEGLRGLLPTKHADLSKPENQALMFHRVIDPFGLTFDDPSHGTKGIVSGKTLPAAANVAGGIAGGLYHDYRGLVSLNPALYPLLSSEWNKAAVADLFSKATGTPVSLTMETAPVGKVAGNVLKGSARIAGQAATKVFPAEVAALKAAGSAAKAELQKIPIIQAQINYAKQDKLLKQMRQEILNRTVKHEREMEKLFAKLNPIRGPRKSELFQMLTFEDGGAAWMDTIRHAKATDPETYNTLLAIKRKLDAQAKWQQAIYKKAGIIDDKGIAAATWGQKYVYSEIKDPAIAQLPLHERFEAIFSDSGAAKYKDKGVTITGSRAERNRFYIQAKAWDTLTPSHDKPSYLPISFAKRDANKRTALDRPSFLGKSLSADRETEQVTLEQQARRAGVREGAHTDDIQVAKTSQLISALTFTTAHRYLKELQEMTESLGGKTGGDPKELIKQGYAKVETGKIWKSFRDLTGGKVGTQPIQGEIWLPARMAKRINEYFLAGPSAKHGLIFALQVPNMVYKMLTLGLDMTYIPRQRVQDIQIMAAEASGSIVNPMEFLRTVIAMRMAIDPKLKGLFPATIDYAHSPHAFRAFEFSDKVNDVIDKITLPINKHFEAENASQNVFRKYIASKTLVEMAWEANPIFKSNVTSWLKGGAEIKDMLKKDPLQSRAMAEYAINGGKDTAAKRMLGDISTAKEIFKDPHGFLKKRMELAEEWIRKNPEKWKEIELRTDRYTGNYRATETLAGKSLDVLLPWWKWDRHAIRLWLVLYSERPMTMLAASTWANSGRYAAHPELRDMSSQDRNRGDIPAFNYDGSRKTVKALDGSKTYQVNANFAQHTPFITGGQDALQAISMLIEGENRGMALMNPVITTGYEYLSGKDTAGHNIANKEKYMQSRGESFDPNDAEKSLRTGEDLPNKMGGGHSLPGITATEFGGKYLREQSKAFLPKGTVPSHFSTPWNPQMQRDGLNQDKPVPAVPGGYGLDTWGLHAVTNNEGQEKAFNQMKAARVIKDAARKGWTRQPDGTWKKGRGLP